MVFFNPLMLVVTKGHTYLNKPASLSWKVSFMYDDFLLPPGAEGLKGVLEIFKEQSLKIRSFPQAVFFEKAVLKFFGKFLENYPRQSAY